MVKRVFDYRSNKATKYSTKPSELNCHPQSLYNFLEQLRRWSFAVTLRMCSIIGTFVIFSDIIFIQNKGINKRKIEKTGKSMTWHVYLIHMQIYFIATNSWVQDFEHEKSICLIHQCTCDIVRIYKQLEYVFRHLRCL